MKRKTKAKIVKWFLMIFIVFSLISIFYVVFATINLNTVTVSSFLYSIGKLAGLIGFLFLSLLIFSGETARFFDRFFGMDTIIRFQRKFALITAIFVLLHPIFFIISSKSLFAYIIPNFTVIPLALGIISLYIFIIIMIASVIYKRISYKVWQYIHILTYLLFFFSLYHSVNWGSDYKFFSIKITYSILLVSIIIGIIYRTRYKIKQKYAGKFHVKEIKNETEDTFTLVLKPEKKFSFKAGQFCFLRLNKDKLFARHPFTISSSPQDKDLSFTIKIQGRFTKAASKLKEGEEVIVEGPFGVFIINDDKKDLVLIAGGVGITPFMSIIKDYLHTGSTQRIILLYGSRTLKDIIFKKELDNINAEWFRKVYVLSQEATLGICEKGFIDKTFINRCIKDFNNKIFYICGPEQMKDCVKKALKELGVRKHNIIIEDFFW